MALRKIERTESAERVRTAKGNNLRGTKLVQKRAVKATQVPEEPADPVPVYDIVDLAAGSNISLTLVAPGAVSAELDVSGEVISFASDFLGAAPSGGKSPYTTEMSVTGPEGPWLPGYVFTCPAGVYEVYIRVTDDNGGIKIGYTDFTALDNLNPC